MSSSSRRLGLPDDAFEQRRPVRGQITKAEVRAVSLYRLGLRQDSVVWDIGAGTGSVSVEAALISHKGVVYAVERDEDSIALLQHNVSRWGPGNVHIVCGEAPEALEALPDPDSVFVGGSGGRLAEILDSAAQRLRPEGHIVVNLATLERAQEALHHLRGLGLESEIVMISAARGKVMGDGATRLEALNPVFIVTGHFSSPSPGGRESEG